MTDNKVNMTSEGAFDFKNVKVEKPVQWLQPGKYLVGMEAAVYVKPDGNKPDGTKKTSYVQVTFQGKDGKVDMKMFVTPKAFQRFQYLYTTWFSKECEKDFSGESNPTDAVGYFFEKSFNSVVAKKIQNNIIVGGRTAPNGKIYAEVPFVEFIIETGKSFEYGPFTSGTADWMKYVTGAPITPATNSNEVMIGVPSVEEDDSNSLPF